MIRVLLVEDDRDLRATLRDALALEGYEVSTAASLSEGLALWAHARPAPDLVLLDLGLPDGDGETLLATLRRRDATPVLVISARQADGQKIRLLDAGADDYLVKPFRVEELLARLRALIRRSSGQVVPELKAGSIALDTRSARVTLDGAPVRLTSHEFRVLSYLMHHAGRVVSQQELVEHVYAQDYDRDSNTLEVFIARLRRKLGAETIETVRGLGYRIGRPVAAS